VGHRTVLAIIIVLVLGAAVEPAHAQRDVERENLADIREINVHIEELAQDAEEAGLTRDLLETYVERRLRDEGIELGNSPLAADLYINVATHLGTTGLYAYCVQVSVQQLVTIEGNQLRTLADTWDVSSVGTVGAGNLPQVQQVVSQIVDLFIEDYFEVNDRR
jgi:hypothetical protein